MFLTPDLVIRRQTLYPAELAVRFFGYKNNYNIVLDKRLEVF